MMRFPSIDKNRRGEDHWTDGPAVLVDHRHVIAVEPKEHRYHSFRPGQEYAVLHLSTGAAIEVFVSAQRVSAAIDAMAAADHELLTAEGHATRG